MTCANIQNSVYAVLRVEVGLVLAAATALVQAGRSGKIATV